ncbi:hypothetical protein PWT90_11088 [Aphanocladium album]|nr:hypothetical protein PWT90_11088 [Aphanocladium album]
MYHTLLVFVSPQAVAPRTQPTTTPPTPTHLKSACTYCRGIPSRPAAMTGPWDDAAIEWREALWPSDGSRTRWTRSGGDTCRYPEATWLYVMDPLMMDVSFKIRVAYLGSGYRQPCNNAAAPSMLPTPMLVHSTSHGRVSYPRHSDAWYALATCTMQLLKMPAIYAYQQTPAHSCAAASLRWRLASFLKPHKTSDGT